MFSVFTCNSRNGLRGALQRTRTIIPTSPKRSFNPIANASVLHAQRARNTCTAGINAQCYRTPDRTSRVHTIFQCSRRTYVASGQPSSPTSFPDPDRPDLFYHLFKPPTPVSNKVPVFALSFLPEKPLSVDSCAVIGWLPAATASEADEAGLNDFKENQKFVGVLHEAIHSALRDGVDDIQMNGAVQTQQGWMHIHDNRNIPALGRIGDPDDIIASVRVEDGKILAETYQPMPSYRLCTSDGIVQLTDGLAQRLKEVLEERTKLEVKSQQS